MPGGEAAVKQPWRMVVSHLKHAFGDGIETSELAKLVRRSEKEIALISEMLGRHINTPVTSSCGRLFDAISCMCGVRDEVTYEGQAAIELEMAADEGEGGSYQTVIESEAGSLVLRTAPMLTDLLNDIRNGTARGVISARFHNWLAAGLLEFALKLRESRGIGTVALSGGCFQNEILLRRTRARLVENGFEVLINRVVPPNDGGISFGQAVVAAAVATENI
jgi:hydrogenase maturation protein HypF